MLKLIFAGLFFMALAGQARAAEFLVPTLTTWQPISVEKNDGIVTIVLPEKIITDAIYSAVIKAGVCPAIIANETLLDGVREIRVLNMYKFRGFVAEGGKELCLKLNAEQSGQARKFTLLAVTYTY